MKLTLTILSLALLVLTGCGKNGADPTKPTNPTNPTGTAISVTSVASGSTAAVYADDDIVITGTGFNADKTKDTVLFGYMSNNKFYPLQGTGGVIPYTTNITSATTTQLTVYATDAVDLDFEEHFGDKKNTNIGIGVYANGKFGFFTITLSPIVEIIRQEDDDKPKQTVDNTYPGDTLKLICNGVILPGTSLTIGGKELQYTVTTLTNSGGTTSTLHTYLPPAFFGGGGSDTATIVSKVALTQSDHKTFSNSLPFWTSPRMTITSMKTDQPGYSKSGGTAVVKMHVIGHCLKTDSYYRIHRTDISDAGTQASLGVSSFPDKVDLSFGLGDLAPGQYSVVIYRTALDGKVTNYGIGSFSVAP